MNRTLSYYFTAAAVIAVFLLLSPLSVPAKNGAGGGGRMAAGAADSSPVGSIRISGKPNATQRLALARISFQQAFKSAIIARPGKLIYGELEVDDGNLDYDFEIVGANGKVIEVQIDAGNGQVIDIDDNAENV